MRKGWANRRTGRHPVGESGVHGHPVKVGSKVPVFIIADDGEPTFEGLAHIVAPCISYPHWYRVRFQHERVDRVRLVLPPSLHDDPILSCALLSEFLRTRGLSPFDEFFPGD